MSDRAFILPKWSLDWKNILVKYQLGHSNTFWTMPILTFNPVQISMGHPLERLGFWAWNSRTLRTLSFCWCCYQNFAVALANTHSSDDFPWKKTTLHKLKVKLLALIKEKETTNEYILTNFYQYSSVWHMVVQN